MIRVALVGAGGMARHYRGVYARLPQVRWVLAVDVNAQELAACKELGVARTSTRFEDALADDIDMVDISTPNHLHEPQAVAALKAGKHVLLQKPMANTLEAADRILDAAATSRGTLGMFMSSYGNPAVWSIRRMIQSGALGQIQSVRARDAHRGGYFAEKGQDKWRSSRQKTGGGSFIQLSIHAVNLLQWWLDSRIGEVSAYCDNRFCPNIGGDDVTVAIARFDCGVLGTLDSGYASDGQSREVYGTAGHVRLLDGDAILQICLDEPYEDDLIRYTTPGEPAQFTMVRRRHDDVQNPYNQHRCFIEALEEGRPPHMSGEAGRQDLAVIMAAYESAERGGTVRVRARAATRPAAAPA